MKPILISQMLQWIQGARLKNTSLSQAGTFCLGVSTDSRSLQANNLFVALKGEHFDGHRFIEYASNHHAGAVIANADSPEAQSANVTTPMVLAPHTGLALQALAKGYRQQFDIPLVLVVGSNGKTTAKEMVHSIFTAHCTLLGQQDAAHCTLGNFNNEVGLPLTLLRLDDHHRYSTVELGMNHPGETAVLAAIAAPTIALINNAQREHQEFMQTVQAVAIEHASVIDALTSDGTAVLPAQDSYINLWRQRAVGKHVLEFALHSQENTTPAAITATRSEQGLSQTLFVHTPLGEMTVYLNTAGEHNARNALAAIAVAIAAGIPLTSIVAGLLAFQPVKGRMQQHTVATAQGSLNLIDDSYNANPDSVAAAIEVLAKTSGRSVLVLGDMGEVGDQGAPFHAEAGQLALVKGLSALYTTGELCKHTHLAFKTSGRACQHFADTDSLNAYLLAHEQQAGTTILVKGSRFMRMEKTVDALLGQSKSASGGH
jgi:UDP-N-acetylmuramoyl-tripeptide--D-alanyl-D-alanine ligase